MPLYSTNVCGFAPDARPLASLWAVCDQVHTNQDPLHSVKHGKVCTPTNRAQQTTSSKQAHCCSTAELTDCSTDCDIWHGLHGRPAPLGAPEPNRPAAEGPCTDGQHGQCLWLLTSKKLLTCCRLTLPHYCQALPCTPLPQTPPDLHRARESQSLPTL